MIITEYELRANWHKTKAKVIVLPPGSVVTPSARDFIRSKGIDVQIEGNGLQDMNRSNLSNASQTLKHSQQETAPTRADSAPPSAAPPGVKPEHMTHLRSGELVTKTHPVIAYRGQLDLFQCELVEAQVYLQSVGEEKLIQHLEEIAALCRQLMVSEVKQEPFHWTTLIGLTPEELRERSHHPKKYFGIEHSPLSYTHGPIVAKLQHLRGKSREVELYANRAFTDESGACSRTDLIQALNRLSSTFYILACEVRSRANQASQAGQTSQTCQASQTDQTDQTNQINQANQTSQTAETKYVPLGTSNRHIHLSQPDLEALFGANYALTVQKDLSQPGQFAARETVTLVGSKGSLDNVRVLGPVRKSTQVELSVTDCFKLGVQPVIRDSGQHEGTPGLKIVGPAGSVELKSGVMVAGRHIHLHTADAQEWCLNDGDRVCVRVESQRPMVYEDVLIRVSDQFRKEMHLDLDEANAALIDPSCRGKLMGV